jgi:UDP-N-acetylmuramyl pentapeptide synthase
MSFDMKETIGITINGDDHKELLEGLTEIKLGKKSDAHRYVRCACDAACWVVITAEDKNGTKWKFKIKRQTLEKIKTADDIFKYLNKLKKQRLRRIGRKIFGW